MKSRTLLGILLVMVLTLAACAPAATQISTIMPPTEEPATEMPSEPPPTEVPATDAATEAAATEAPAETATGAVPATGAATVEVSESADFGPILVDSAGMSLYLFTKDTQNSGASTCTGDCLVKWPALVSDGDPVVGEGVDESLLGTITRDDGTTQVTYNGWPLYYYAEDTAPGDTTGQGVGDVWFLVTPEGEAVP